MQLQGAAKQILAQNDQALGPSTPERDRFNWIALAKNLVALATELLLISW
jgi:hypothetical protein